MNVCCAAHPCGEYRIAFFQLSEHTPAPHHVETSSVPSILRQLTARLAQCNRPSIPG